MGYAIQIMYTLLTYVLLHVTHAQHQRFLHESVFINTGFLYFDTVSGVGILMEKVSDF